MTFCRVKSLSSVVDDVSFNRAVLNDSIIDHKQILDFVFHFQPNVIESIFNYATIRRQQTGKTKTLEELILPTFYKPFLL